MRISGGTIPPTNAAKRSGDSGSSCCRDSSVARCRAAVDDGEVAEEEETGKEIELEEEEDATAPTADETLLSAAFRL